MKPIPLQMQYVSSPIHTYCIGCAASMGSLLLAAGEKGKRHCLPNASIMIHRTSHPIRSLHPSSNCSSPEPSGGASGQASDVAIHAKEILRVREALTGIYQKHCAKPDESEADGLARFGERNVPPCTVQRHTKRLRRTRPRAGLLHDRCVCWRLGYACR